MPALGFLINPSKPRPIKCRHRGIAASQHLSQLEIF